MGNILRGGGNEEKWGGEKEQKIGIRGIGRGIGREKWGKREKSGRGGKDGKRDVQLHRIVKY